MGFVSSTVPITANQDLQQVAVCIGWCLDCLVVTRSSFSVDYRSKLTALNRTRGLAVERNDLVIDNLQPSKSGSALAVYTVAVAGVFSPEFDRVVK